MDEHEEVRRLYDRAAAARALAELSDCGTAENLKGYAAGLEFLADAMKRMKAGEGLSFANDNGRVPTLAHIGMSGVRK